MTSPFSTAPLRRAVLTVLLGSVIASCASDVPDDGPLPKRLDNRMHELIHRIQYSQGVARLKDLRELSAFGPHATGPVREKLLESDNPQLRSNAVFVLGEIHRLDGDLDALALVRRALDDPERSVRLEASRALLECGDRSGVGELISALDDPARGVRIRAYLAVRDAAGGRNFGYDPDAESAARREAILEIRSYFGGAGAAGSWGS